MPDVSHFEALSRLLRLEHRDTEARLAEERQGRTARELVARGVAWDDLEAKEERVGLGGRIHVLFERPGRAGIDGGLDPGAVVCLRSKRDAETSWTRAIVSRRRATSIELAFDDPPPEELRNGRIWCELGADEVTLRRGLYALSAFSEMEKGSERRRRDAVLALAPPRFLDLAQPQLDSELNAEQGEAVTRALAAEDFFLVHGPPGTGKSTVLGEVAALTAAEGGRVLATAPSNAAVDHLVDLAVARGLRVVRVGHPARVSERLHPHTLDALVEDHESYRLARELFDEALELSGYARRQRTRGRSRERFANAREAQREASDLRKRAREFERQAVHNVLEQAQVVCATCTALGGGELAHEQFDLCLFDEATQATEPLSLLAFLRARRVILAGDHKQLPPTVISERAAREGLSRSLFERLLDDHGDAVKLMLREQYRMHEDIMRFASRTMYGGELRAHRSVAQRTLTSLCPSLVDAQPLVFVDTAGKGFDEELDTGEESLANPGEATLVAARARELLDAGLAPSDLGIIAPYRAQAALLRARLGPELHAAGLEVDTIDAFQGREKEAILVSFTRSNPLGVVGFLSELRRTNVAITRAKRQLWLVGDSGTLAQHPYYSALIDEARAQGGYRSAWELPYA